VKEKDKTDTTIDSLLGLKSAAVKPPANEAVPISPTSDISKREREAYVSNLPKGLTPTDVMELMNNALVAMQANIKLGNPIISAWMSAENNYAFLEFRSPEEAKNSHKLDGITILGHTLKIGKPKYNDNNINTGDGNGNQSSKFYFIIYLYV
jgi:hypothetical protein